MTKEAWIVHVVQYHAALALNKAFAHKLGIACKEVKTLLRFHLLNLSRQY